jgi:hypothetical protein
MGEKLVSVTNFADYPCGVDGNSFPQGLPDDGQEVRVLTIWSEGKWERKTFKETYTYKRTYEWFGVYGKPDIRNGSLPIVLDWKPLEEATQ